MKKPISLPAIIAAVVVALALVAFFLTRVGGTNEFPAPPTSNLIPDYVWSQMPAAAQSAARAEGKKPEGEATQAEKQAAKDMREKANAARQNQK